jgi:cell shape-determining protein MreD
MNNPDPSKAVILMELVSSLTGSRDIDHADQYCRSQTLNALLWSVLFAVLAREKTRTKAMR